MARNSDRASISPICATSRARRTGSFVEADHLDGDVDMVALVRLCSRRKRAGEGRDAPTRRSRCGPTTAICSPTTSTRRRINPGYSCVGRLKGLAELRGVMQTFEWLAAG